MMRPSLLRTGNTLSGLLALELRSALPVTMGLVLAAAVALGACRFGFEIVLPDGGVGQIAMIVALMAAVALPLTAELLEADWRRGTARTLQALPVNQTLLLVSKFAAGVIALAVGFLVLWIVDCCLVAAEPSPDFDVMSALDVTNFLAAPSFVPVTLVICWIGLVVTGLVAVVFRHALGATLIGGLVALGPVAVPYAMSSGIGAPNWLMGAAYGIVHQPFVFVTLLIALTLLVPAGFKLRGVRARSTPRRSLVVLGSTLGLFTATYGGLALAWRLEAAPRFDDPTGDPNPLYHESVSPDGSWAIIDMTHRRGLSRRSALWLVDAETLEVRLLPDVNLELGSWFLYPLDGGFSSFDGEEVFGNIRRDNEGRRYGHFALNVVTGSVRETDYDELQQQVTHGGWIFERPSRTEPDPKNRFIEAQRGDVQVTLNSWRKPSVPKLAPHLLFYTDGAGQVIRFNSETGAYFELGVSNWEESLLRVSPTGAWITVSKATKTAKGPFLYEVATGRSRGVKRPWFNTAGGRYPMLEHSDHRLSQWTRVGLDDEVTFTTERVVDSMVSLGESQWLGRKVNGGVYVFALDGSLIKTLREPRPETQP